MILSSWHGFREQEWSLNNIMPKAMRKVLGVHIAAGWQRDIKGKLVLGKSFVEATAKLAVG